MLNLVTEGIGVIMCGILSVTPVTPIPVNPYSINALEIKKETPQKVFAKSAKYITLILYAGACGRSVPCVRFFSFYKCPKGQEGE